MSTTANIGLPARRPSALSALANAGASVTGLNDCWNTLGVRGARTCPRLHEIIHCRHCPDYSAAGIHLLNRLPPPDSRREWTRHFSQPKKLHGVARSSLLLFRIGPEWLGLPTQVFQEVAEGRPVHSLPHRSRRPGSLVLGMVNIRGQLVLCVSVGRLLNLNREICGTHERDAQHSCHRLLVTNWNGHRLAFPVDEVHGTHRYGISELKPVPATLAPAGSNYTRGVLPWREQSVGCLDVEPFFAALNRSLA